MIPSLLNNNNCSAKQQKKGMKIKGKQRIGDERKDIPQTFISSEHHYSCLSITPLHSKEKNYQKWKKLIFTANHTQKITYLQIHPNFPMSATWYTCIFSLMVYQQFPVVLLWCKNVDDFIPSMIIFPPHLSMKPIGPNEPWNMFQNPWSLTQNYKKLHSYFGKGPPPPQRYPYWCLVSLSRSHTWAAKIANTKIMGFTWK